MTVFRQVLISALLVSLGFVLGARCSRGPVAAVTVTDAGGNVLTPAQFSQLMELQAKANEDQQAVYAATVVQQQKEYEERMDRYFAMLGAKARFDYNLGIIHRSDSGVLLERHIHNQTKAL